MASNCDDFAIMRRRHCVDEGSLLILFPENQVRTIGLKNRGFESMDSPVCESRDFKRSTVDFLLQIDVISLHQKSVW